MIENLIFIHDTSNGSSSMLNYRYILFLILIISTFTIAQESRLVVDTFYSEALEGNLLGDSPQQKVIVYLPPSYNSNVNRHYQTLYLLHGNSARYEGKFNPNTNWISGHYQGMNIKILMDSLAEAGIVREMIIVMPNGRNYYRGCHYVNSSVTGNWADYIVHDLVNYIDKTYRTIPAWQSRGLAGHSMGAKGAFHLAMIHPDVFGTIYSMSGGMNFNYLLNKNNDDEELWQKLLKLQDISKAEPSMVKKIGISAAFSPNPDRPPFFVDFPYELNNDTLRKLPEVRKRWQAFNLVNMVSSQRSNLQRLKAIGFDCGTSDANITANRALANALSGEEISFVYEEYEGTHGNQIRNRMAKKVLPFFSENLGYSNSTGFSEKE